MLQQTQVDRVIPKYEAFISRFPTFETLAMASQIDVLFVWQGLGYNRRALALKRLAIEVVKKYNGRLPTSVALLEELPGVGPYTARAIAVFSWNEPQPLIETNIRNVYTHFFFEGMGQIEDREILALVEKTLPEKNSREWYYALMDYGAMLKKTHRYLNSCSKHYTKQSKFNGSDRQIRGTILKFLLSSSAAQSTLCATLDIEAKRCRKILAQLEAEGFLQKNLRMYQIKSDLTTYI
ncbi:MAG: A/G-specific adenine glycosylase [Parcubacteria group bacterium Greene0714_4]|nr:MAG: A/G-specific adenine glycosylase [Parcubacteria group bacterium Greene1014_15]TSD08302.1 MAG: A/G-specific adenine glycosylase [Parcubacteria group bacterium Greene0714_4]